MVSLTTIVIVLTESFEVEVESVVCVEDEVEVSMSDFGVEHAMNVNRIENKNKTTKNIWVTLTIEVSEMSRRSARDSNQFVNLDFIRVM